MAKRHSIISITDKYRALIDEYCFTLQRYSEGGELIEKGKFAGHRTKSGWKEEGYFPNIQQVLRRVIDLEAHQCGEEYNSIQQYIAKLDELDRKYGQLKDIKKPHHS